MMILKLLSSLIILTEIMYTFIQFYAKNLFVIFSSLKLRRRGRVEEGV